MKSQIIKVGEKNIYVFDDAFTFKKRSHIFDLMHDSSYRLAGSSSGTDPDERQTMMCMYTPEHLSQLGLFNNLPQEIIDVVNGYRWIRQYSLVSNWSVTGKFHVDGVNGITSGCPDSSGPPEYTFLYYANLKWNYDEGGETLFANDDMSEIVFASMFKPGRIIIFDSSIPHRPIPPIPTSSALRYSLVVNLMKDTK